MIEGKTECKELKDAIVTLWRLSGSELQQAIFEAELDAKRLKNAEISTAKEEGMKEGIKKGVEKGIKKGIKEGIKKGKEEGMKAGIKEGEIKSKIEDVIAFAKTGMSLKLICQTLNVGENIKKQAIKKLNEMGVRYFD